MVNPAEVAQRYLQENPEPEQTFQFAVEAEALPPWAALPPMQVAHVFPADWPITRGGEPVSRFHRRTWVPNTGDWANYEQLLPATRVPIGQEVHLHYKQVLTPNGFPHGYQWVVSSRRSRYCEIHPTRCTRALLMPVEEQADAQA